MWSELNLALLKLVFSKETLSDYDDSTYLLVVPLGPLLLLTIYSKSSIGIERVKIPNMW